MFRRCNVSREQFSGNSKYRLTHLCCKVSRSLLLLYHITATATTTTIFPSTNITTTTTTTTTTSTTTILMLAFWGCSSWCTNFLLRVWEIQYLHFPSNWISFRQEFALKRPNKLTTIHSKVNQMNIIRAKPAVQILKITTPRFVCVQR